MNKMIDNWSPSRTTSTVVEKRKKKIPRDKTTNQSQDRRTKGSKKSGLQENGIPEYVWKEPRCCFKVDTV